MTKLYILAPRPGLIPRPRLIERLDEGLRRGHNLTLISAAAGFGKATLISAWLGRIDVPVGWLSLKENDSDLTRFLRYPSAALAQAMPDLHRHQTAH